MTKTQKIVYLKELQRDRHSRDARKQTKKGKGKIKADGEHWRNSQLTIPIKG